MVYEDVPDPAPGPGEALVKVAACGVNRIDIWGRTGRYTTYLPHVLGTDIAGQVASEIPGSEEFHAGSNVVIYPVISDGTCHYCRMRRPSLCLKRGFIGIASDGGYADFVKVPIANLIPAEGVDPKVAAAIPVDFGTAWSGLVNKAGVGPGDTVLVWGAAGGLGHAAVEISKLNGAKVIAGVGDDSKSAYVRSLGADEVVNYKSSGVVEAVKRLTGGLGASVVFDHVGGDTWGRSIDCLARGGRLLALGLTSGAKAEVDVRRVYSEELNVMGTYGQRKEDIEKVMGLVSSGRLAPTIREVLPLASARKAHEDIEARSVMGKIVLVP